MRFLILLAVAGGLTAAEMTPEEYIGYVKFLAAGNMRGRATGSPELEKASKYIDEDLSEIPVEEEPDRVVRIGNREGISPGA